MTQIFDELKHWQVLSYPAFRILIIWLMAWVLLRFLRKLLGALKVHIGRSNRTGDLRRIETLTSVFRYASNVVIAGMVIMLTLSEVGISITPILATAGVAGIAIGFGAQSLVKDFFTGLFLLIENQVSEGDEIEAAGKAGYVERVTLRHIRMRDYDGSVHFIPNGMITSVTNKSRGFVYAVIDLGVPRQLETERVFEQMRAVVASMRKDAQLGRFILDDIDIAGVEKIEDAAVTLRCRIKAVPSKQWRIRREFLRRMKPFLDEAKEAASPPAAEVS